MTELVDSIIQIKTPESIAFQHEIAGPFRRLPAFLLDVAIRAGILLLGVLTAILVAPALQNLGISWGAFLVLVWFFLEWFYGGFFEAYWNGRTPGKWFFGLRVISQTGRPINGLQAMLRNVLRAADLMPLVPLSMAEGGVGPNLPTGLLGLLSSALTTRFQRLGDLVCGTIVVVEPAARSVPIGGSSDPAIVALMAKIPAMFRADRELTRALAMYYERRSQFSPLRRHELARQLGEGLAARFSLPADTSYDHLLCALYERIFAQARDVPSTSWGNETELLLDDRVKPGASM